MNNKIQHLNPTGLLNNPAFPRVVVTQGNGIKLFKDGRPEQKLEFVSVKSFETGLV
jgi:hypothetical protein